MGVLATLMTYTSHAMGPNPHVQQGLINHPLIIWSLLIGPTSTGKKGTARHAAATVMEMAAPEMAGEDAGFLLDGIPESGAALVSGLLEMNAPVPIWHREDGFPVLVAEEEWAKALLRGRVDKNFSVNLRKLWERKSISSITKKDGRLILKNPHVCITGHATPREFRDSLGAADLAGGTINRFLVFSVFRSKALPFGGDLDMGRIKPLVSQLRKYVEAAQKTHAVKMDAGARKLWETLYTDLEALAASGEDMEQFTGRTIPHVLRTAGLYALTTPGPPIITANDLNASVALVRYSIESVRHVMQSDIGPDGKSSLAVKIFNVVSSGPIKASELREVIGRHRSKERIDAAVREWRGDIAVWPDPTPTGGRRGHVYGLAKNIPAGIEPIIGSLPEEPEPPVAPPTPAPARSVPAKQIPLKPLPVKPVAAKPVTAKSPTNPLNGRGKVVGFRI